MRVGHVRILHFPFSILHLDDAHGTNAEWYNRVCGDVFMAFAGPDGVDLEPKSAEVNTNAYYFVDVVAEGIALVHFVADGPSRLGSPAVIAQAGETNRVPLLIGATYSVTSTVPLQIFAPAEAVVDAHGRNGGGEWTFGISWPVTMGYTVVDGLAVPDVSDSDRLQGTFSWTGGCCVRHVGDAMQFCCQGCGCGGCTANVNYLYEGYLLATQGPSCGCSSEHEGAPHVETDAGGGVSVEFDRKAVIFENAYDNSPSNHVARRSTQTVLTLRANGGIHGGTLSVTTRNLSRLNLDEGTRPLGTRTLAPYEPYEAVSTNSGLRASTSRNDIEIQAAFTENDTGERVSVHTDMTSVRLELSAVYEAPENATCTNSLSHTKDPGAGKTHRISPGNYWTLDLAGRTSAYQNWSPGRMDWKIPIGWFRFFQGRPIESEIDAPDKEDRRVRDSRPLLIGDSGTYRQIFTIDENGTFKIEKHGHWLSRSTNCVITLDGRVIQERHP